MTLIHRLTILICLEVLFSYVNHQLLQLPMTIGLMAMMLVSSLVLLMLGKLGFGVEVESTRYTLTFHCRWAKDMAAVEHTLLLLLGRLPPALRLITGKASVNALPPCSTGRGAATLTLMAHLRCRGVLFVGADETDEGVFGLDEDLIMGGACQTTGWITSLLLPEASD